MSPRSSVAPPKTPHHGLETWITLQNSGLSSEDLRVFTSARKKSCFQRTLGCYESRSTQHKPVILSSRPPYSCHPKCPVNTGVFHINPPETLTSSQNPPKSKDLIIPRTPAPTAFQKNLLVLGRHLGSRKRHDCNETADPRAKNGVYRPIFGSAFC